jgi:hypothetical protein
MSLMKNHEGYSDPTAGTAIRNIMMEQKQRKKRIKFKKRRFKKNKGRRNKNGNN